MPSQLQCLEVGSHWLFGPCVDFNLVVVRMKVERKVVMFNSPEYSEVLAPL